MRVFLRLLLLLAITSSALAASRHIIRFGPPMPVKLFVGPSNAKAQEIQVRALYVDAKLREFTTGEPHDVTDRIFVVRKAYRVNDSLPDDPKKIPIWRWQRGGWLLVDRTSGRSSTLNLPEFDPYYSAASWYRDYIAYCGISDNGEKVYAVVAQIGEKKPVLLRELGAAHAREEPDSECPPPKWQRDPPRVTFEPAGAAPVTLEVRPRFTESTSEQAD